jgi:hypothetical protein
MKKGLVSLLASAALALSSLTSPDVEAQQRPYNGFTYPAGGKQGTTFQITAGGQYLDGIDKIYVSGEGIEAKLIEYNRHLSPQDIMLLREQLDELKKSKSKSSEDQTLIAKLEKRIREYVLRPASVSISNLVIAEIKIADNAKPGDREIRLETPRGVSNPMVFNIGQLPEYTLSPLPTSPQQVLGKEEDSLRRKRKTISTEDQGMMSSSSSQRDTQDSAIRINVPATINGQIFSGEIHQYKFQAKKNQHIVISARGRELIPYIADAVPGWFQPVLALHDSKGKEISYNDDYRFKPDPVLHCKIPNDGEYLFSIYDGIYRGREDFVYRVTIGELPFVTSVFPLGGKVNEPVSIEIKGYNLPSTRLTPNTKDAESGVYPIAIKKEGFLSNRVLFALDTLPESLEREPNNKIETAQKINLPIIINGRIDVEGDKDIFQFEGRAGEQVVAEIMARRLDSPLDSTLKITDEKGKQIAYNDDREDIGSGVNTHHADSYLRFTLPSDGKYFIHLKDAQNAGGEEYAYRLRVSAPRPDFALRIVPSSVSLRPSSSASVSIHAIRQDGFDGDISVKLRDAPKGFSSYESTLSGTQEVSQISISTSLDSLEKPVPLYLEGRANVNGKEIIHDAIPAEDRMQAFLWRHLVPAREFIATIIDSNYTPQRTSTKRIKKK